MKKCLMPKLDWCIKNLWKVHSKKLPYTTVKANAVIKVSIDHSQPNILGIVYAQIVSTQPVSGAKV